MVGKIEVEIKAELDKDDYDKIRRRVKKYYCFEEDDKLNRVRLLYEDFNTIPIEDWNKNLTPLIKNIGQIIHRFDEETKEIEKEIKRVPKDNIKERINLELKLYYLKYAMDYCWAVTREFDYLIKLVDRDEITKHRAHTSRLCQKFEDFRDTIIWRYCDIDDNIDGTLLELIDHRY